METEECLVTPTTQEAVLRSDQETSSIDFDEVKKNVPAVTGNFVEVPVMIGE